MTDDNRLRAHLIVNTMLGGCDCHHCRRTDAFRLALLAEPGPEMYLRFATERDTEGPCCICGHEVASARGSFDKRASHALCIGCCDVAIALTRSRGIHTAAGVLSRVLFRAVAS